MPDLLILGAGYVGGALAERALAAGESVTLADNWYATEREQLAALEQAGAQVVTADIRSREDVDALVGERPGRVVLLAAQASRPISEREPDYTEETNVTGARRVAEAVAAIGGGVGGIPILFGSSLHVYGSGLSGEVDADRPYGPQGDLAHLSKVYAELCLRMYAERHAFGLALLRLGIVYGPSPVMHDRPDSVTVVDKFRRMAAAGEPLTVDAGGTATIGAVHVADVARILHEAWPSGVEAANVAAETISVADVAALAEGREPSGGATWTVRSPLEYEHRVAEYLAS